MARFNLSPSRLARYYFLECDRFLRYDATPQERRAGEGVPPRSPDRSPVTRALLEGGYGWEEQVVRAHLGTRALLADGPDDQPLNQRRHTVEATLNALTRAKPGDAIYQPTVRTPSSFYKRYGLDPDLIEVVKSYPDLLMVLEGDDGPEVRVVDVKASDAAKLSHRVQVGIYTLLLRHLLEEEGLDDRVRVSRVGGVWLFQHDQPEWFELSSILPPIESFLERELTRLLESPADEAFWHLNYRCEWCDYFTHCRDEAEFTDDVSQVPYLSSFAKRHLASQGVGTIEGFERLLQRPDADLALAGSASLEGRRAHFSRLVEALRTSEERPTGASSAALPRGEHVRLVLTLQQEPISGEIYGYAINRVGGKDLFDAGRWTAARVASDGAPETLARLRRDLVTDLMGILGPLHDFNLARSGDWPAQKTLQTYVFDSYERELLVSALLRVIEEEQELAVIEDALRLLFHFQHPDLAAADDHPAAEVFFPVVVLTEVLRSLVALPIPVAHRFADVNAALQPAQYGWEYRHNDYFDFKLSNRLKSDAILSIWTDGRLDLLERLEKRLRQRVWAANSVLNGLRERLDTGVLFAWPPKFFLPDSFGLREPVLSRLAFITQYEAVLSHLETRGGRTLPLEERLQAGETLALRHLDGNWYQLYPRHADVVLETGSMHDRILTVDSEAGRRARLAFDDFLYRNKHYAPKKQAMAYAAVREVTPDRRVRLELKPTQAFQRPQPGAVCYLEERFTDWTSQPLIEELKALDAEGGGRFVQLVRNPPGNRRLLALEPKVRAAARELAAQYSMTASQLQAFEGVVDHDVQLVWGPPGTGKTHFLALATLCLAEAHRRSDRPLRVLVTAFTHAAIDNLLGKIVELQEELEIFGGTLPLAKLETYRNGGPVSSLDPKEAADFARYNPIFVVGATVWKARRVDPDDLDYDLVVIDEGSQVKVAEAAIPIRRLAPGGRLLIAGDDKQLPPIVRGDYPQVDGEPLLHRSILECLRAGDVRGDLTAPLLENFRMCDVLCEYPRTSIYPEGYGPANEEVARRRLPVAVRERNARPNAVDELVEAVIDPAYPLVVCVLEDVQATAENRVEAGLVARLASELRKRLDVASDEEFWRERLFIVSPHHVQIQAIGRALAKGRPWTSAPFVDTVDKMQGQECDAVIVSYGVSDVEYALAEREFIYSLNRLNVAITRARAKSIVFLARPLLDPPIQALDHDDVADGIAFMQGLANWCQAHSEPLSIELLEGRVTVLRG